MLILWLTCMQHHVLRMNILCILICQNSTPFTCATPCPAYTHSKSFLVLKMGVVSTIGLLSSLGRTSSFCVCIGELLDAVCGLFLNVICGFLICVIYGFVCAISVFRRFFASGIPSSLISCTILWTLIFGTLIEDCCFQRLPF